MEPGPRLDALIAQHIFGGPPLVEYMDMSSGTCRIPAYSTDISAAWEVVEKMKEIKVKGWDVDKEEEIFPINIIWKNDDQVWEVVWSPAYWKNEHFTEAPTAPHAICLAALKAVGVEVE